VKKTWEEAFLMEFVHKVAHILSSSLDTVL